MYKERVELIRKEVTKKVLKLAYKGSKERVDKNVEGSKIKLPNFSPDFF